MPAMLFAGLPASGKSTLAADVAQSLAAPDAMIDTDRPLERGLETVLTLSGSA